VAAKRENAQLEQARVKDVMAPKQQGLNDGMSPHTAASSLCEDERPQAWR